MLDLTKILAVGQNSVFRQTVQRSHTAANYNGVLNELLATPACVEMVIKAAVDTIDKYLPEDYTSVGCYVKFVHTAPTSLGMTISVKTSITVIDDNHVFLDITAWDEMGEIGYGRHKRAVVHRDSLLKRAKERTKFLAQRSL